MNKLRHLGSLEKEKKGFTIIEVMIFLAISGLLLVGVLSGTYAAISTQRYNDSVRDFAEFLRQLYSEVISPESIGAVNGDFGGGNSDDYAIYGKVAVFGLNSETTVYTATLVGSTNIPTSTTSDELALELSSVGAKLFCGIEEAGTTIYDTTVSSYTPLWQTQIDTDKSSGGGLMQGTLIIARSPVSGMVRTIYRPNFTPDIASKCQPTNKTASIAFSDDLRNNRKSYVVADINFCLRSNRSNFIRDIVLGADGHNTTAINLLDSEDGRNACL